MANRFASGKNAIAECDVCGFRYKLTQLKPLIIKTKRVNILACPECWNPDQPQLQLGMYPIDDPQAIRDPRPDTSYCSSRDIQWGWGPVGGGNSISDTPNDLLAIGQVGSVLVEADFNPQPSPPPPPPVPVFPTCGTITEGISGPYGEDSATSYGYIGTPTNAPCGSIFPGTIDQYTAVTEIYDRYIQVYNMSTGEYDTVYSFSGVRVVGVPGTVVQVEIGSITVSVTVPFYDDTVQFYTPFGFTGTGTTAYCASVTYAPTPPAYPVYFAGLITQGYYDFDTGTPLPPGTGEYGYVSRTNYFTGSFTGLQTYAGAITPETIVTPFGTAQVYTVYDEFSEFEYGYSSYIAVVIEDEYLADNPPIPRAIFTRYIMNGRATPSREGIFYRGRWDLAGPTPVSYRYAIWYYYTERIGFIPANPAGTQYPYLFQVNNPLTPSVLNDTLTKGTQVNPSDPLDVGYGLISTYMGVSPGVGTYTSGYIDGASGSGFLYELADLYYDGEYWQSIISIVTPGFPGDDRTGFFETLEINGNIYREIDAISSYTYTGPLGYGFVVTTWVFDSAPFGLRDVPARNFTITSYYAPS